MFRKLKGFFAACLVTAVYWTYTRFCRYKHLNPPSKEETPHPHIYAHWHGDELLLVGACTHMKMAVMSSRSRDGQLMKRVLSWMGYYVVWGSSTRGGAGGLKGLIDAVVKKGYHASLAVDGPRGPIYKVKPGILKLAQKTGRPLIPGAAAANRKYVFEKAWNHCYLPLPFSRCIILYGKPMCVPKDLSEEAFEERRELFEKELFRLKEEAEKMVKLPKRRWVLQPSGV